MIKCLQCNTLYAESAKVCVFCKVPLPQEIPSESKEFDFEFNQVNSEEEANQIRLTLLGRDVPCIIIRENDRFKIMIESKDRGNAFRDSKEKNLFLGGFSKEKKNSSKFSKVITYLVLFILALFSFLFLRLKSEKEMPKEIIIYEGTVDPRIMPKESRSSKKNESKQKPKSQPESRRNEQRTKPKD